MQGLHKRLALGSGANALSLVARSAQQLLLIPVLLSTWSLSLFGDWIIVSAIPTYIALSDFGFLAAGSNELARRASQEDEESVRNFFDHYVIYFKRWSIFIAIILSFLSFSLPLSSWLNLEVMEPAVASTVFLLLTLSALISQNSLSILSGLRVRGSFPLGLMISAISSIAQVIVLFLVMELFSSGPVTVAALYLLFSMATYLLQREALRRRGLRTRLGVFSRLRPKEEMRPYLLMGLEMMLMPLAQALVLQGSIILIGFSLGSAAAAAFSTHRTLARLSASVLQLFSIPLRAEAGMLRSSSDRPALTEVVLVLSRVTFWLSIVISAIILASGVKIFQIWTHEKILFNYMLFIPLIIGVIAESVWRISTSVRLGTNRHRPLAWGYLIFSSIGLLISWKLMQIIGLEGVGIGTMLVDISMAALGIFTLRGVISTEPKEYFLSLLRPPVKEARAAMAFVLKLWKRR